MAELSAWNQKVLTKKSIDIKEVGAGVLQQDPNLQGFEEPTNVNLSMVTQDSRDERMVDKKIGVDHILQGQDADDSVEKQAINQIGEGDCCEDGFHVADILIKDIVSLDNSIINHVWDKGSD